ncbi:hypothetical protein K443DRAFT_685005 [Laccaria amethystina LaAM-08-1]|uniref:Uncharacterized protein n=1 Tax=Laccaria amethystina LaAM-08-1 TaxID=1095629 RepID=A0A0C9WPI4_9AGAR|nr:hypothetical protein K443DRAFT_685005 [Laccaria amethystina LaAM-08-1]
MPGQEENEHRDTNPSQVCPQAFYFSPQPLFTTDHSIHNPGRPLKSSKPNAHDNTAAMGPMTTGKPKRRHEDTTGLTMAWRAKRLHSQTTTLQIHDARAQTARYTNKLTTNDRATPDNEDLGGTGGMVIQGGVGSPTILKEEWLRPPASLVSQNVYSILLP